MEEVWIGNDGEDWKCLRIFGLEYDGVGGIATCAFCGSVCVLAGVKMVSPRLVGRRLGGLGGLEKERDTTSKSEVPFKEDAIGNEVVEAARAICSCPDVFTARFLRFLGRFPGVVGRCDSEKDPGHCKPLSLSEV